jgi:hypothetical protein
VVDGADCVRLCSVRLAEREPGTTLDPVVYPSASLRQPGRLPGLLQRGQRPRGGSRGPTPAEGRETDARLFARRLLRSLLCRTAARTPGQGQPGPLADACPPPPPLCVCESRSHQRHVLRLRFPGAAAAAPPQ